MRHFASRRFWQSFEALPAAIRTLAVRNYALLKRDPAHPSLQFKAIHGGRFRSVRIGLHYRPLAYRWRRASSGSGSAVMPTMTG